MKTNLQDIWDEKNLILKIFGKITPEMANRAEEVLALYASRHKNRQLTVSINSQDGFNNPSVRICNAIWKLNRSEYWTIGAAKAAYSGGLLILSACQLRLGFPDSRFHLNRLVPEKKNHLLSEQDKKSEKSIFEFLAMATDESIASMYDLANAGKFFGSEEALRLKFLGMICDHKTPLLPKGVFYFI
jgi:ATP-dependent protease ClpP protease subunit